MASLSPDSSVASDFVSSPNHGERRVGASPDAIILHYTGMARAEDALARLTQQGTDVSCHYFVWEDGRVTQLVREDRRAWHAGASYWRGERDLNSVSLGVEIANPGHDFSSPPYPAAQIEAVIDLCRDLARRRAIPPERILAHSDVAPSRKRDPGEYFPWDRLHAAGIGHWTEPAPLLDAESSLGRGDVGANIRWLNCALSLYGYEICDLDRYDASTEDAVRAFQRHFRQSRVDGRADKSTRETLRVLLAGLGLSAD